MSQRKQSYSCSDTVVVLFDGAKSFWKTRTNLDILIVEHTRQMCIELIAYNSVLGVEAPRIYLSSLLLSSKIDQEDVKLKLNEKKEALIRMKKTVNINELTKEITVNMIIQYLLSRLSIPNDLPTGELTVVLLPNSGDKVVDEDSQRMDIVCEKPNGIAPLEVAYQKKLTANDFQNAIDKLQSESMALKQATNIAELATSSVDGFKLVLAEKMRLEIEMRRKCSLPRLRWIKAINRVLVQNYCAIVRARLDAMAAEEAAAKAELEALSSGGKTGRKQRPKILRKSIDNSQLNKLPTLKSPIAAAEGLTVGIPTSESSRGGHLPVLLSPNAASAGLTPMAAAAADRERRRARVTSNAGSTKNERAGLTRRSFGQEHYPQYSPLSQQQQRSNVVNDESIEKGTSSAVSLLGTSPPSLIKSYNSFSQKVLQPLSIPAIDKSEGGVRSIRIVNNK